MARPLLSPAVLDGNRGSASHDAAGGTRTVAVPRQGPLLVRVCHERESINVARDGERASRLGDQVHNKAKYGVNAMTAIWGEATER